MRYNTCVCANSDDATCVLSRHQFFENSENVYEEGHTHMLMPLHPSLSLVLSRFGAVTGLGEYGGRVQTLPRMVTMTVDADASIPKDKHTCRDRHLAKCECKERLSTLGSWRTRSGSVTSSNLSARTYLRMRACMHAFSLCTCVFSHACPH